MTNWIVADDDGDFDGSMRWVIDDRSGPNDTPPLFSSVRDQPYSRGSLTSTPRTASPAYIAFLQRNKEVRDGR
jgi:hypothetical protein